MPKLGRPSLSSRQTVERDAFDLLSRNPSLRPVDFVRWLYRNWELWPRYRNLPKPEPRTVQNWFAEVRRKFIAVEDGTPSYGEWKPQYLESNDGVDESTLMRLNLVSLSLTERPLDVRIAKWATWLLNQGFDRDPVVQWTIAREYSLEHHYSQVMDIERNLKTLDWIVAAQTWKPENVEVAATWYGSVYAPLLPLTYISEPPLKLHMDSQVWTLQDLQLLDGDNEGTWQQFLVKALTEPKLVMA